MKRRLVVPRELLREGRAELRDEPAHYLGDVLRLDVGAVVELIDGDGGVARATIAGIARGRIDLAIDLLQSVPAPSPRLTLLQAIGKGEKMDLVVRQAAEIGVARLIPIHTRRAVAERSGRAARWRAIAEDALRVSERAHRLEIDAALSLEAALASPRTELAICADLAAPRGLRDVLSQSGNPRSVELLIGPEGGFEPEELRAIEAAGFVRAHLGPHTLRTETAGPILAAVLLYGLGAFEPVDPLVQRR